MSRESDYEDNPQFVQYEESSMARAKAILELLDAAPAFHGLPDGTRLPNVVFRCSQGHPLVTVYGYYCYWVIGGQDTRGIDLVAVGPEQARPGESVLEESTPHIAPKHFCKAHIEGPVKKELAKYAREISGRCGAEFAPSKLGQVTCSAHSALVFDEFGEYRTTFHCPLCKQGSYVLRQDTLLRRYVEAIIKRKKSIKIDGYTQRG